MAVSYIKTSDRGGNVSMLSSPAIMMFLFTGDARALSRYQAVTSGLYVPLHHPPRFVDLSPHKFDSYLNSEPLFSYRDQYKRKELIHNEWVSLTEINTSHGVHRCRIATPSQSHS